MASGLDEVTAQVLLNKKVVRNEQTGTTYTFGLGDHDKVVELNNASAITATVPAGLPEGWNCIVVQTGAGQVTFAAGAGATVNSADSNLAISAQYASATLYSQGSDTYMLIGDLA